MKQLIGGTKDNIHRNETSSTPDSNPVVYGLATAYSAAFTVLAVILVTVMGLLLGARWSPAIVLCASAAACLLLLISLLRFENALVSSKFHMSNVVFMSFVKLKLSSTKFVTNGFLCF